VNHPPAPENYVEPSFEDIHQSVLDAGFRVSVRTLRRYHLSLKTRGFVILSGVSGTGKTWLTKAYADAIGAKYLLVPVAPNWTTNEDLLGYFNPLDNAYYDTDFSRFLREAANEYERAERESRTPTPFHLVLDEMNLARVEYYFAKFLATMETRMREGTALVGLGPREAVHLSPNFFFIGTVNVDETTHGFANKVYDRAQLLELQVDPEDLERHIGDAPYRDHLMQIWSITEPVAPFAYRIVDEIKNYVANASRLGVDWDEAFDEQLLQKVLPKLKGTDLRVGEALEQFVAVTQHEFPLSSAKAKEMADGYHQHGFASYF
jgi:5-methylcytosine-specific restriction endonuclease McrBC GTP-binding regulatory subunit McrB